MLMIKLLFRVSVPSNMTDLMDQRYLSHHLHISNYLQVEKHNQSTNQDAQRNSEGKKPKA